MNDPVGSEEVGRAVEALEAALKPNLENPAVIKSLRTALGFAESLALILGSVQLIRVLLPHGFFDQNEEAATVMVTQCDNLTSAIIEGKPLDSSGLLALTTKAVQA